MAFKPYALIRRRRRAFLFPLMDLFFLLLLFYLAAVAGGYPERQDAALPYPTPTPSCGAANIFIQILDLPSLLWVDARSAAPAQPHGPYPVGIVASVNELPARVADYTAAMGVCIGSSTQIVIRCPGDVAVVDALRIQAIVAKAFTSDHHGIDPLFALSYGSASQLGAPVIDELDGHTVYLIPFADGL